MSGTVKTPSVSDLDLTQRVVEVYDGFGNCIASEELQKTGSTVYSFDLVPGSYRVVAYFTNIGGNYDSHRIDFIQSDLTLANGESESVDFDFGRFTAGNSTCGRVSLETQFDTGSSNLRVRTVATATVPGGEKWVYTTNWSVPTEADPTGVYGVRNGAIYVYSDPVLVGLDPMTGGVVFRNDDVPGRYNWPRFMFLPNGDLFLNTEDHSMHFVLINTVGQVLMTADAPMNGLAYDLNFSYMNGKVRISYLDDTGYSATRREYYVDVSRYM